MSSAALRRQRIAIFVHDEPVWSFPAWRETIPALVGNHDVVGLWLFPDPVPKRLGMSMPRWYATVFGLWNFLLLGMFALRVRFVSLFSEPRGWEALSRQHGFALHRGESPNDDAVCRWVTEQGIDVVFAMVGNILKPKLIRSPRLGIISKHAALLPSCRGVYPFFWGRLNGIPLGVSFHAVTEEIDAGPLLAQQRIDCSEETSMLRFYRGVFARYPVFASEALERLISGESLQSAPGVAASYFGFPTRADVRQFIAKGYRIARVSDLFHRGE